VLLAMSLTGMLKWATPWIATIMSSRDENTASSPVLIEIRCRADPKDGP
jgi:hypothetical protein